MKIIIDVSFFFPGPVIDFDNIGAYYYYNKLPSLSFKGTFVIKSCARKNK